MQDKFAALCEQLTNKIKGAYEEGVTIERAESLASEFLYAQIQVAYLLKVYDLDSRMKKTGLKAIKAAVYMEAATKDPKKPSDVLLQNMVDMNEIVVGEQKSFDEAEVEKDNLYNYLNIFKEAHIHFRGISKGRFGD